MPLRYLCWHYDVLLCVFEVVVWDDDTQVREGLQYASKIFAPYNVLFCAFEVLGCDDNIQVRGVVCNMPLRCNIQESDKQPRLIYSCADCAHLPARQSSKWPT